MKSERFTSSSKHGKFLKLKITPYAYSSSLDANSKKALTAWLAYFI